MAIANTETDLVTINKTQNYEQSIPQPLNFGTQNTQMSLLCSTKCSKSKNCKVLQTLRDYGTKKVSF